MPSRRGVLAAAMLAATFGPDSLRPWRWRARLLLTFAPAADDPALRSQHAMLAAAAAGSALRDLVPIEVIGNHSSTNRVDGSDLRRDFGVAVDRFCVILIGKDGGEKMRVDHPIAPQAVFAVIDAMPMGRAEAARRAQP